MTKSHYPAFQKASRTISDILMNHQKNPKCVRCQKKIKIPETCITHSIKGMKMGKSKINNSFSSLPFSFISGTFVDTPYSLLCYKCTNFVKRSIGFIPELWDDKYFPQVSTPLLFDDLGKRVKKAKWTIRFQKKEYAHTKQLKDKLLDEGITLYLKRFPECPHDKFKLKRLVNGHKLYDKMYGKW